MLRTLGAVCIVLSASAAGFGFAAGIRVQLRQLEAFLDALCIMKSEIELRLTPLVEVFRLLEASPERAVGAFFGVCRERLERGDCLSLTGVFSDAARAVPQLRLSGRSLRTLGSLALCLGKFDLLGQSRAIDLAAERLKQERDTLRAGARQRAGSYGALGVCAGLAAVILLI